jgi:hypothetical protein
MVSSLSVSKQLLQASAGGLDKNILTRNLRQINGFFQTLVADISLVTTMHDIFTGRF